MKPLDLREYAETLRVSGTGDESEFGREILEYMDFAETAEHEELCEDLQHYCPSDLHEKPRKMAEWLGDRHHLLIEIEKIFEEHAERFQMAGISLEQDPDDIVKALCGLLPTEYDL